MEIHVKQKKAWLDKSIKLVEVYLELVEVYLEPLATVIPRILQMFEFVLCY